MRLGQNPQKFVYEVAQPERITVAVLSYIPFQSGFYRDALDVLKVSLQSLQDKPGLPYDLFVFDNGSCDEAQDYLLSEHRNGNIPYLLLSKKNLGKGGAWNIILGGAPGEIIAYADSDVLFSPGWLSASVQILETFPKVGMITARPFATEPDDYSATIKWAQSDPKVTMEQGKFIPWTTFHEFLYSLGREETEIRMQYEINQDIRLTYKGVRAMVGASHWQFVGYKDVLKRFLPFRMDRPMGQAKQLDQRMNSAGYLRLMTEEPFAMNLSNTLREVPPPETISGKKKANGKYTILDVPIIRRVMLGIYDRIFRLYFDRQ